MRLAVGCFCLAAGLAAGPVHAAESAWSFDFGQGVAEYAVGSFADSGSHFSLSCSEGGVAPGSVSVWLVRAGFAPGKPTVATVITDKGRVRLALDADGWARWPSVGAAPPFRTLWRLLATGSTLNIAYGPGAPMTFPLKGARALMAEGVCPKQLAS